MSISPLPIQRCDALKGTCGARPSEQTIREALALAPEELSERAKAKWMADYCVERGVMTMKEETFRKRLRKAA